MRFDNGILYACRRFIDFFSFVTPRLIIIILFFDYTPRRQPFLLLFSFTFLTTECGLRLFRCFTIYMPLSIFTPPATSDYFDALFYYFISRCFVTYALSRAFNDIDAFMHAIFFHTPPYYLLFVYDAHLFYDLFAMPRALIISLRYAFADISCFTLFTPLYHAIFIIYSDSFIYLSFVD